jgi:LSD1 subclass zinc finger protein
MFFGRFGFREKIARFMYGRCGYDDLSRFLMGVCLVLLVANLFLELFTIAVIEMALLVYTTFRVMSKNLVKRNAENAKYMALKRKFDSKFKLIKNKHRDRKTHVYHKCPHCKNTLRLPRIKGAHTVNCPCCHTKFEMKVR